MATVEELQTKLERSEAARAKLRVTLVRLLLWEEAHPPLLGSGQGASACAGRQCRRQTLEGAGRSGLGLPAPPPPPFPSGHCLHPVPTHHPPLTPANHAPQNVLKEQALNTGELLKQHQAVKGQLAEASQRAERERAARVEAQGSLAVLHRWATAAVGRGYVGGGARVGALQPCGTARVDARCWRWAGAASSPT